MTAAPAIKVRVWVTDVWDDVELSLPADTTISDLKRVAFRQATGKSRDLSEYEVKWKGALVIDEGKTLTDLGAADGAPFIILPARRRPVW